MKLPTTQCARELLESIRLVHMRFTGLFQHPTGQENGDFSFDLTVPQLNMLRAVRTLEPVSVKQLAEALHVSPPSTSGMVERLVEIQALTREQNPSDRREVLIGLSPRGRKGVEWFEQRLLEAVCEMMDRIGPKHAQMWCEVGERLREILSEEEPPPPGKETSDD